MLDIDPNSSPEHVIINIYIRYGIEYLLQVLDGVFTFILFDYNYQNEISKVFVVKDLFGMIPVYTTTNNKSIAFSTCDPTTIASSSTDMILSRSYLMKREPFGTYTMYELGSKVSAEWVISKTIDRSYFTVPNTVISSSYSNYIGVFSKCIKRVILKMDDIPDRIADFVVEKLHARISDQFSFNTPPSASLEGAEMNGLVWLPSASAMRKGVDNDMNDITIYDGTIKYSPMNFFEFLSNETMFDYDIRVRKQLYSAEFDSNDTTIRYPFFDRDFVSLYFSIPLYIRYSRHEELFF
jgi:hypothetical protein